MNKDRCEETGSRRLRTRTNLWRSLRQNFDASMTRLMAQLSQGEGPDIFGLPMSQLEIFRKQAFWRI